MLGIFNSGADVNEVSQDSHKQTALHVAVENDLPEMISILLRHGADPSIRDAHGDTALLRAVDLGSLSCTVALLAAPNIVIDECDITSLTPLMIAAKRHPDMVSVLLQGGASPWTCDSRGLTPLDHALVGKQNASVKMIRKARLEAHPSSS